MVSREESFELKLMVCYVTELKIVAMSADCNSIQGFEISGMEIGKSRDTPRYGIMRVT